MKRIAVASKNPVKIHAVEQGFKLLFPAMEFSIEGYAVSSGVNDQPLSDNETFQGALNRVNHLSKTADADYWVAIEGGMEEINNEFHVFAWAVAKSKDNKIGKGKTVTFILPDAVSKHIREGKELAHAADIVFNESESGKKQGTIGILTGNHIDRTRYNLDAVIMALIPFKNPDLY